MKGWLRGGFGVVTIGLDLGGWRMDELLATSGKLTYLWKITIFNGKTHYKWPFSIAMLNYQRLTKTGLS